MSITLTQATVYTGPGVADGGAANDGGAISSVDINNTASTITFTINSTASMASYIFYSIELQDGSGGDTSLVNPWGPHVGMSTGVNALVNTYGTGASALTYSGGTWTQNGPGQSFDAGGQGSSFATMTFSLSSLGLSVGSTFNFDVVSSYTANPSGQAAYSALDNTGYLAESDNSYQPWTGGNFYDSATASGSTLNSYTVVPEPSIAALFGLGGLVIAGKTWRRKG